MNWATGSDLTARNLANAAQAAADAAQADATQGIAAAAAADGKAVAAQGAANTAVASAATADGKAVAAQADATQGIAAAATADGKAVAAQATADAALPKAGRTTNAATGAGMVGEYIESVILAGGAVPLTSTVSADVTFIDLTAGWWRLGGGVYALTEATTSVTAITGNWSLTSAGYDPAKGFAMRSAAFVPAVATTGGAIKPDVIYCAAPTRIYLCARCVFTVAGLSAFGEISAERVAKV